MLPNLDANYPALILKMSRRVIPPGALAVARTLGRAGVPVYAVVDDAFAPLALTRYIKKAFIWDSCPDDPGSFVRAMAVIGKFIARPTIVIPMDDQSAVFLATHAASLAPWFIVPPVPPELPHRLSNKACLHALCAEIGIPSARTIFPHSLEDVRAFAEETTFPVLVKGAKQWVPLKDMSSTRVIQTADQLASFCENCNYEGSQPLIVQEYIPGEDWISHGYYNSGKKVSVTFTGKKLRAYPSEAGSTALGLSIENEELRRA